MRASVLSEKRARTLRRGMSLPEVVLWAELRGDGAGGLRFRRQHPLGPWILDFYASKARLAVEIDGVQHTDPQAVRHDARRDGWLAQHGVRVLRFTAAEVLNDEHREAVVLPTIVRAAQAY